MKYSVRIIFFVFCFLSFRLVYANYSLKKNAIYLELFGNGIKGSINYDRTINWKNLKFKNVARVGLGYDYSGAHDSLKWSHT